MGKTSILIESETRQLLRRVGRKEQTYDDVINELVAEVKRCEKGSPDLRIATSTVRRPIQTDQGVQGEAP